MKTIKINCSNCGLDIDYWTKNNYIICTKCNTNIKVEPCKDVNNNLTLDDLLERRIIFFDEVWNEETGEYWLEYYEDEDCTIEITDIEEFVSNYKEVE